MPPTGPRRVALSGTPADGGRTHGATHRRGGWREFAGLWAAAGAARPRLPARPAPWILPGAARALDLAGAAGALDLAGAARALDLAGETGIEITLVNPDPRHVIRVRCYEDDLAPIALPLDSVLAPIGVHRLQGTVTAIDLAARRVTLDASATTLAYDRLVLAAGSSLRRPPVPGLAANAFDVDSLAGAERLARHVAGLGAADTPGAGPPW